MIGQNSKDLFQYAGILKGNYKKGISNFRNILSNKETAEEFCSAVGVNILFGLEIKESAYIHDRNSVELLALLNECGYYDMALRTFLAEKSGLEGTLDEIINNETAMAAVAASDTAMAAVIASETAMAAVIASETAMAAVAASETAMAAVIASETAMAAVIASETAMAAVAASETAMAAVIASETAMAAVIASETAMAAVIASETAMAAVAASETAMAAVAASETAMAAVIASETAMAAVIASETAMAAVAASPTAVAAVAASPVAAEKIGIAIQSNRARILLTLGTANSTYFTYASKTIGNGAGTFGDGENTNTIYIPYKCMDDNDTNYEVRYGYDGTQRIASISRHSGDIAVDTGVSFRGVRVIGTGSSTGNVTFHVYTAI